MRSNDQSGLPLTFDECRARFRRSCERAGSGWTAEPIAARGPFDQTLTIDHTTIGAARPRRALVLMSGVHGVEAFVNSAIQCDLIDRLDQAALPSDMAVVVVHVVNPWGMAHGRRQNESNVDLNRNWGRSRHEPSHNDAYDEVHPLVCPDTDDVPDLGEIIERLAPLIDEHGEEWVRHAITRGQYRHRDGLHFGGDRTEESNLVVERIVPSQVAGADRVFIMDLHTGDGAYGEIVVLSDRPRGSTQDELLRELFEHVEATPDRPDGTSRVKAGPIARGIADELGRRREAVQATVATVEVGTVADLEQLTATVHEQWAHRRGRHERHPDIRWRYRTCFTPDDPEWEAAALDGGRRHVDAALDAVAAGR